MPSRLAAMMSAVLLLVACEVPTPDPLNEEDYLLEDVWSDFVVPELPYTSISYSGDGGETCYESEPEDSCVGMDIYVPEGATGSTPTVLYVFGGGFFMGDRHQLIAPNSLGDWPIGGSILAQLRSSQPLRGGSREWIVAAMDYPLLYQDPSVPLYVYVQRAVRALKAAGSLGDASVDPDAVVLAGSSAGGHLAMLAALRSEYDPLIGSEPNSEVVGVVNLDGPTDIGAVYKDDPEIEAFLRADAAGLAALGELEPQEKVNFTALYGYDFGEITQPPGTIIDTTDILNAYAGCSPHEAGCVDVIADLSPISYVDPLNSRMAGLRFYMACTEQGAVPFDSFCDDHENFVEAVAALRYGEPDAGLFAYIDRLEPAQITDHYTVDSFVNMRWVDNFLDLVAG